MMMQYLYDVIGYEWAILIKSVQTEMYISEVQVNSWRRTASVPIHQPILTARTNSPSWSNLPSFGESASCLHYYCSMVNVWEERFITLLYYRGNIHLFWGRFLEIARDIRFVKNSNKQKLNLMNAYSEIGFLLIPWNDNYLILN